MSSPLKKVGAWGIEISDFKCVTPVAVGLAQIEQGQVIDGVVMARLGEKLRKAREAQE